MKKQNKTKPSPYLIAALILSFIIPILVMLLIFIERRIYPFGSSSFLRTDLYHQYAPFFQEFRNKLVEGESLSYSWKVGAGTNFAALYAYYLASPINWLVALVPKSNVIEFITYLIVFKIGLSGLSFTWYLHRHTGSQSLSLSLFGIAYALSGYMAAYSWNIMWLDCIALFPLIILGLEQLVHQGKFLLYCITLGLSILSNYYISIMTCFFLVLYFVFLLLTQEKFQPGKLPKQMGLFAFSSLLAGALAACVLIPEIYALSTTASSKSNFPKEVTSYFSILDMLARHLDLVEVEEGLDHWPNLFCGISVLMLIPLYVMNRRRSYKEKIGYLVLIFFLLASFSLNTLNFIWHGLHYPNSLPCRQSYIYVFLMLVISFWGLQGVPDRNNKQLVSVFWIAVSLIVIIQAVCQDDAITVAVIWVSLIFIGLYALLLYLYRQNRIDPFLLVLLALILVVTENTINTGETSVTTINRNTYMDIDQAEDTLKDIIDKQDPGFYRMEKSSQRTKNDGAWLGYSSASTFSSMSYASMSGFYKNLGMEGSTNAFSTNGATPFAYSLLNVRYLLSSEELPDSLLYQEVGSAPYNTGEMEHTLYLYENLYTLPLGFVLPAEMTSWKCQQATPFAEQDSFISQATGVSSLFTTQTAQASGKQCQAAVTVSGHGYAYTTGSAKEVTVTHGSFSKQFSNVNRGYLLDLGYCEKGETIIISSTENDQTVSATIGIFDEAAFIQAYEELAEDSMTVESYTADHITASVNSKGGLLMMSIPYDQGWSVKVDGADTEPLCFADTFLALSVNSGIHTIELSYAPPGQSMGILISLIALVLLAFIITLLRFWKRPVKAKAPVESNEAPSIQPMADTTEKS